MKKGAELREALFIAAVVVFSSVLWIWGPGLGVELIIGLIGLVVLAVALFFGRRSRRITRTVTRTVSFLHVPGGDPAQQAVAAGMHYPQLESVDPAFHYEWQLNSNANGSVVGALHRHEEDLVGSELRRDRGGQLWAKCQCGAETVVPDRLGASGGAGAGGQT